LREVRPIFRLGVRTRPDYLCLESIQDGAVGSPHLGGPGGVDAQLADDVQLAGVAVGPADPEITGQDVAEPKLVPVAEPESIDAPCIGELVFEYAKGRT